ncbi:MAG: hypothetical protein WC205_11035 [Opitutaceae bacterium]|jgi:hypothetical protein
MIKSLIATLAALTVVSAYATTPVITDSFTTYSPGAITTGSSPAVWATPGVGAGTVDNGTDLTSRITTDSGNLFGKGTSNQYLKLSDTSNANTADNLNLGVNPVTIGEIGTVSFDFYSPTTAGSQGEGFLFRIGTLVGNGATTFGLFINNGQLRAATTSSVTPAASSFATYALDTMQSLTIVFNSSASTLNYASRSLAAGKMDVYLNGTIVGTALDGAGGFAGLQKTNAAVGFTRKTNGNTASDFVGTLNIDNLNVYSGVELSAIPEPATAAVFGGVAVLLTAMMVRRRPASVKASQ